MDLEIGDQVIHTEERFRGKTFVVRTGLTVKNPYGQNWQDGQPRYGCEDLSGERSAYPTGWCYFTRESLLLLPTEAVRATERLTIPCPRCGLPWVTVAPEHMGETVTERRTVAGQYGYLTEVPYLVTSCRCWRCEYAWEHEAEAP